VPLSRLRALSTELSACFVNKRSEVHLLLTNILTNT
jgi:hypothetical protein